jgi:hypothetical protein
MYFRRRSFGISPACMVELFETTITIDPVQGDAEKEDQ